MNVRAAPPPGCADWVKTSAPELPFTRMDWMSAYVIGVSLLNDTVVPLTVTESLLPSPMMVNAFPLLKFNPPDGTASPLVKSTVRLDAEPLKVSEESKLALMEYVGPEMMAICSTPLLIE